MKGFFNPDQLVAILGCPYSTALALLNDPAQAITMEQLAKLGPDFSRKPDLKRLRILEVTNTTVTIKYKTRSATIPYILDPKDDTEEMLADLFTMSEMMTERENSAYYVRGQLSRDMLLSDKIHRKLNRLLQEEYEEFAKHFSQILRLYYPGKVKLHPDPGLSSDL